MKIKSAYERVMDRVNTTDPGECWLFQGALSVGGYGVTRRTNLPSDGMAYVHRVTYEALVGPIPSGHHLDHLCRVRACCNPQHLEPVTPAENVMRSTSHIALNASKTECPSGHPYDEENTYVYRGARQCRICRNRHRETWRRRAGGSNPLPRQPLRAEGGASNA